MAIKADIAFVFHWSPEAISNLQFDEMLIYHGLAIERMKAGLVGL